MARGGFRPGAGRKKRLVGTDPEIDAATRDVVRRQVAQGPRKKAIDVMSEMMNFLFGLAAFHQPREANPNADIKKFLEYGTKAAVIAARLASFETPTLTAMRVSQIPLDLSKLSNEELIQLEQLHVKAAVLDGDQGGTPAPLH